jgi:hypothetical protein
MGGHPFLHLPSVGPAPQHQGKLSLTSLISSWNFCIISLSPVTYPELLYYFSHIFSSCASYLLPFQFLY